MSKVIVVNEKGIIVERTYATASYRSPKGKTVKPQSDWELEQYERYSALQVQIQETLVQLREVQLQMEKAAQHLNAYTLKVEDIFSRLQSQEHECYAPGQVVELMEQWQRDSAQLTGEAYAAGAARVCRSGLGILEGLQQKKLEHLTARSAAAARIEALRQNLYELTLLQIDVETSEGTESWDADIDLRTKGRLTAMEKELDEISRRIYTGDPAQTQADNGLLEKMEQELSRLPDEARQVFAAQLHREDEMQRIAQRLEDSGWELLELQRGETLHDDCYLYIQGSRMEKATIRFCLDGMMEIVSHFQEDAFRTRENLRQLVMDTIEEGGEKAKSRCLDEEQEQAAAGVAQPMAEPDQEPERLIQRLRSEVQGERRQESV